MALSFRVLRDLAKWWTLLIMVNNYCHSSWFCLVTFKEKIHSYDFPFPKCICLWLTNEQYFTEVKAKLVFQISTFENVPCNCWDNIRSFFAPITPSWIDYLPYLTLRKIRYCLFQLISSLKRSNRLDWLLKFEITKKKNIPFIFKIIQIYHFRA